MSLCILTLNPTKINPERRDNPNFSLKVFIDIEGFREQQADDHAPDERIVEQVPAVAYYSRQNVTIKERQKIRLSSDIVEVG